MEELTITIKNQCRSNWNAKDIEDCEECHGSLVLSMLTNVADNRVVGNEILLVTNRPALERREDTCDDAWIQ